MFSFTKNLVSISRLLLYGYSFKFLDTFFSLFNKFDYVWKDILSYDIYCLNLQNNITYNSIHVNIGTKR